MRCVGFFLIVLSMSGCGTLHEMFHDYQASIAKSLAKADDAVYYARGNCADNPQVMEFVFQIEKLTLDAENLQARAGNDGSWQAAEARANEAARLGDRIYQLCPKKHEEPSTQP